MKSLIGQIALIIAIFLALLLTLGSGFGQVEITIWFVALIGLISVSVWRHRRKSHA